MPRTKARLLLVLIWFGFFIADLCIVLYLDFRGYIGPANFEASFKQLAASYSPFLGVIMLFYFGTKGQKIRDTSHAHTAAVLAMVTSLFWNCIIFAFFARLVLMKGSIEDSVRAVGFVGSVLAWIVSPALGYYFAKSGGVGDPEGGMK
jgi:hypothetical protein